MTKKVVALFLAVTLVFAFAGEKAKASDKNLIIATATTGGTYYPVGVAIGTLISIKLAKKYKITATAINSAGSGENIQMLKNKEADLAILQALFGAMAYNGKQLYEGNPIKDFRAITMLWENVEHFVLLKKYAKTGNIMDLKGLGEKFSIGKRGSGTEGSGKVILGALGIEIGKDFTPEYLPYSQSAQAMIDGRIAGANLPAGPPVAAVSQLFAQLGADDVVILEFTDEQLEKVRNAYPVWNRYVIPPGT
ncbi:MAG: TAXI family TRAP transporter solute-binding subunit, partial [Deltaproteobacteria bacterium]